MCWGRGGRRVGGLDAAYPGVSCDFVVPLALLRFYDVVFYGEVIGLRLHGQINSFLVGYGGLILVVGFEFMWFLVFACALCECAFSSV